MLSFFKRIPFQKNFVALTNFQMKPYHFSARTGTVGDNPGLTAKRIIKCVRDRLVKIDPGRWESVPITFKTHFRDENGYTDIYTCTHIHDALEKEFGVDIQDKQILINDIETAFHIIMISEGSV